MDSVKYSLAYELVHAIDKHISLGTRLFYDNDVLLDSLDQVVHASLNYTLTIGRVDRPQKTGYFLVVDSREQFNTVVNSIAHLLRGDL